MLMAVPSMRVLSLVRQVRGFQDFMFQVGKLRLLGSVCPRRHRQSCVLS